MGAPIWEVKSFNSYNKGHFYVLNGTQSHPSRILDAEKIYIDNGTFTAPPNCEVIKVPEVYRPDFSDRLEKALQNLAGKQTARDDKPFDDLDRMEDPLLIPEFNLVAPQGSKIKLINKLPKDLFIKTPQGLRLRRYPNALRYIHLDLAETSEAGIGMVHKEIGPSGETLFVQDFVCWVTSPTRIDLNAIQDMMIDFATIAGIRIHTLSADQFQSASIRQKLQNDKVADNINLQSVDRSANAYLGLSNVIASDLYRVGVCPKLKHQLEAISIEDNKVNTRGRKDMADTVAGAIENARVNVRDVPIYEYDKFKTDIGIEEIIDINTVEEL
jgi:hypothetical protein